VVRAYCDVFEDCSLWAGLRFDWMLVGSRNARYAPSHAEFARQWEDSRAGPELRAVGLERPEQIGALFLADAPYLREFTRGTPPLVDDFPKRLADEFVEDDRIDETYAELLDTEASRERFRRSEFIRSAWPETMRESSLECFAYERIIREASGMRWSSGTIEELHALLTESSLQTVVLWLLGTGGDELRAADRLLARGDSLARPPLRPPGSPRSCGAGLRARQRLPRARDGGLPAESASARAPALCSVHGGPLR
jgi:hypothetical protein